MLLRITTAEESSTYPTTHWYEVLDPKSGVLYIETISMFSEEPNSKMSKTFIQGEKFRRNRGFLRLPDRFRIVCEIDIVAMSSGFWASPAYKPIRTAADEVASLLEQFGEDLVDISGGHLLEYEPGPFSNRIFPDLFDA